MNLCNAGPFPSLPPMVGFSCPNATAPMSDLLNTAASLSGFSINSAELISQALPNEAMLPDWMADKLADGELSDEDICTLAYIQTGEKYLVSDTIYTGDNDNDLDSDFSIKVFYPESAADYFWCPDCFVLIDDNSLYIADSIGESGIFDWSLGYYLEPIANAPQSVKRVSDIAVDNLNNRLSAGYSSSPYSELKNQLVPESSPVWSDKLQAFVGAFMNVAVPCKIYPCAPCIG